MAGQPSPQRSCFRNARGAALRSPPHPQPGHLPGSTAERLPASCPNRRPWEAPWSFGRHSPATDSRLPSCEILLALGAQNWLPARGPPGGETEAGGVACWLSKHTAPPPRRVGPLRRNYYYRFDKIAALLQSPIHSPRDHNSVTVSKLTRSGVNNI